MHQIKYKNQNQPILFHFYRQKEHICVTLSKTPQNRENGTHWKFCREERKKELNSRLILFVVSIARIFITLYYFLGIPKPDNCVAHDLSTYSGV